MRIFFIIIFSSFGGNVLGQLSWVNLAEVQFGKLPDELADPFVSWYDRLTIDYRFSAFKLSATIENYQSPYEDRNYIDLSQATLTYKKKKWTAKLGNFYETIGRGMILRSFEIPGALLEDFGFRSRNYFHRDQLGASIRYKDKKWNVMAMYSEVLNNVLPPTFERSERRSQSVYAISGDYKFYNKHKLGLSYVASDDARLDMQHLYGINISGPFSDNFSYYVEFANSQSDANDYAIYAGVNGILGDVSFNIEFKNYKDFIIGNGYNEPPALIKQHTYRVLNRSTHVTNPLDETGYQLDLYYSLNDISSINFNHALAVNEFGNSTFTFQEYYVEWSNALNERTDYKIFIDYAEDPFKAESQRVSLGAYWDFALGESMRISPEIEFQTFDRSGQRVNNHSYALGWQVDKKLFFSLIVEGTTDTFLIFDADAAQRWYVGSNIRIKPNYKHTLNLFIGERRGGPLCNAGVCYEILDFKGMELRWTARF